MDIATTCTEIFSLQRQRRFAIKVQSKLDRALESYVRVYYTDWDPEAPEKERERENRKALAILKAVRDGKAHDEVLSEMVRRSDESRKTWDEFRDAREKRMEELARTLPVWEWARTIKGFAGEGKFLAIIVGETTSESAPASLGSYAPERGGVKGLEGVFSRLGLVQYGKPEDGGQYAMSTWKVEKWRPREKGLGREEWIDNPYSGKRYAEAYDMITKVLMQQLIGKAQQRIRLADGSEAWWKPGKDKDGNDREFPDGAEVIDEGGETRPNGPYGEVYCRRLAHTLVTHPEWTPKHRQRDAMRVALRALIADLYREWMDRTPPPADEMPDAA